jgi:urease accessory protein
MTMPFLLWQLADSAFPSGAFAHSSGLEASLHHGVIAGLEDVAGFARQILVQTAYGSLPLFREVHRNPDRLVEMDRLCNAFLSSAVANRASRAQGRSLLTSVARSFPDRGCAQLEELARHERIGCHLAPIFGGVTRLLGIEEGDGERLALFLAVRGVGAAAIRLGLLGAYDAQALQSRMQGDIDPTILATRHLMACDIMQTAPILELFQSTHDRLYSRLFQS